MLIRHPDVYQANMTKEFPEYWEGRLKEGMCFVFRLEAGTASIGIGRGLSEAQEAERTGFTVLYGTRESWSFQTDEHRLIVFDSLLKQEMDRSVSVRLTERQISALVSLVAAQTNRYSAPGANLATEDYQLWNDIGTAAERMLRARREAGWK